MDHYRGDGGVEVEAKGHHGHEGEFPFDEDEEDHADAAKGKPIVS